MSHFKDVNVVYAYVSDWERAKKFYRETSRVAGGMVG